MVRERKAAAGCLLRTLSILVLAVLVAGAAVTFWVGSPPEVIVKPGARGIGRRTPVAVRIADTGRLERLRVELVQNADVTPLAERTFEPRPAWAFWKRATPEEIQVEGGRDTVKGLRTGQATVRAVAEPAGTWLRHPAPVTVQVELPVRLAPPALGLVSTQHYVAQGGCEAVVYRVGESSIRDGVRSGDWWFPGFPMPGPDRQLRFALFAVP